MNYETLLFAIDSNVATITLNRPAQLNALNLELGTELIHAIEEVEANVNVRCVIVTGSGRAFCSGGDVKAMISFEDQRRAREFLEGALRSFHQAVLALRELSKPTIAAVNGSAVGAGMNLALACDVVYAAEDATFSQAFVHLGLVPDCGGTFLLPRLIGPSRAAELMLTGDTVHARRAREMGLVSHAIPAEQLMMEARALARRLASGPPNALRKTKELLRGTYERGFGETLEMEYRAQLECADSPDFAEGLHAFWQKRPPRFGRG